VGPRHPVRPAERRPHRKHPDEPAAARALRIPVRTRSRQRRSETQWVSGCKGVD